MYHTPAPPATARSNHGTMPSDFVTPTPGALTARSGRSAASPGAQTTMTTTSKGKTFQKTLPPRNNLRIGPSDMFAFSSFLAQSAVFGSGSSPTQPEQDEEAMTEQPYKPGKPAAPPRGNAMRPAFVNRLAVSPRGTEIGGTSAAEAKSTKGPKGLTPQGHPTKKEKKKLGILTDQLTPEAMAYVRNELIPQAIDEANANLRKNNVKEEDVPKDWRRHSLHVDQDGAIASSAQEAAAQEARRRKAGNKAKMLVPQLSPRDVELTFFAKNEDGMCRGKEYVSMHGPNSRGIQSAVDKLSSRAEANGGNGRHAHVQLAQKKHRSSVEESSVTLKLGGKKRNTKRSTKDDGTFDLDESVVSQGDEKPFADEEDDDDHDSVYYTSSSDDEDTGEFAPQRKEKAAIRHKQRARAFAETKRAMQVKMKSKSGSNKQPNVDMSGLRTLPTGCGNCDYVAGTLDRFDNKMAAGKTGHITRLTRPKPASSYGGSSQVAQRETARLSLLAGTSYSSPSSLASPLQLFMNYHAMNKFVLTLTPRCALALRRAVLRHFGDDLVNEAATAPQFGGSNVELTLLEFLSCLLHIPKSIVSNNFHASLATPIEVNSCVCMETIETNFRLRHKSSYAPQHTSQLAQAPALGKHFKAAQAAMQAANLPKAPGTEGKSPTVKSAPLFGSAPSHPASAAGGGVGSAKGGRTNPLKVDDLTIGSVLAWEKLFELYDPQHTGTVNKSLFLLNILVATNDAEETKDQFPFGVDPWTDDDNDMEDNSLQSPPHDNGISWNAENAKQFKVKRINGNKNNRVKYSVAWMVALLRQRPDSEGIRPGEFFSLRDILTGEVRQHYTSKILTQKAEARMQSERKKKDLLSTPRQQSICGSTFGSSTGRRSKPSTPSTNEFSPLSTKRNLVSLEKALAKSAGFSSHNLKAGLSSSGSQTQHQQQQARAHPTVPPLNHQPTPGGASPRSLSPFGAMEVNYLDALERFSTAAHEMVDSGELLNGNQLSSILVENFAIVA